MSTATKKSVYSTVYQSGGFGWRKMVVKLHEVENRDYAQYRNIPSFVYTEKGKRTKYRIHVTRGGVVILAGDHHPEPPSGLKTEEIVPGSGLVVKSSIFGSFDPRYDEMFHEWFAKYLAESGAEVLHDWRKSE